MQEQTLNPGLTKTVSQHAACCEVKLRKENIPSFPPSFKITPESLNMLNCIKRLWGDEDGMILSSEVVLVGTILVIGSIAGLSSLQYAVTNELNDTARAYDSYTVSDDDYGGDNYAIHDSEGRREVVCDGY